jgi:molybdenum cofactor guanylyltransferase
VLPPEPLNMISAKDITATILAGGQSRRFGSDKARARLANNLPCIAHLNSLLDKLGLQTVALTEHEDKYKDLGIDCIADLAPNQGPLGGIESAFAQLNTPYILLLSCDMPNLTEELLRLLISKTPNSSEYSHFCSEQKTHPFPAIVAKSTQKIVNELLTNKKNKSMMNFIRQLNHVNTLEITSDHAAFFNMNTKEEHAYLNNKGK